MRIFCSLCIVSIVLLGCEDNRVYEHITDFDQRQWLVSEKPTFEFVIDDTTSNYNLYGDVRNSVSYPYSRFFFTYYLQDSSGVDVQKKLMTEFLFDAKTGKPFGKSGIGDLYDHRFLLLKNYQFKTKGKYRMVFEQFMRMDALPGILAVGLRVEKVVPGKETDTY
ncbi:MAG TPA: gliding motility lipoprotein GldH [Chryseolinea sp.]|nr:gliding motility lipoprotein GldH [Chryseolinea sp.]